MKFFCNGRAAHLGAAFEHQWFESGFGEIEGGDQPIVSTTNDNDVACLGHMSWFGHQAAPSFRISSAARRPGAPIMPPPGCVADPHMYRFLIGERNCAHPATGRRKNNCSSESSPWKILPSVSPQVRSRSRGVTTWR